ncbi:hypothetical protein MKW94_017031 [Papaver nudicaule]|uniref:RRM domain-containing protein n=1 Tax=Papaver nudicaule TaxID=74823 RepID=A0AA41S3C3_PAPNU|nr:hypothetical protein [Papaver nudicaule]
MAKEQRVEDEVDTEPQSEQDDAEVVEEEETEEEKEEEDITKLLEPFSKEQLIDIIQSVVVSTKNTEVIEEIHRRADKDPSHCELFVRGLDWETTSDQLKEIFSAYGEIGYCKIVFDRNTGRSKGYGFILYKHRKSVSKALKEPVKKIGDRMVSCYLSSHHQQQRRKIYVDNVDSEISVMKLYSYFLKYGEIESGPLGYDKQTGKFKGYASFIYKTAEGVRRALEEPIKRIDGYTLYCDYCQSGNDKRKFDSNGVLSSYADVAAGFNTQNGAPQTYGQGIPGGGAQPYGHGILSGAAQPYRQGILTVPAQPYDGQGILSGDAQPYGQSTQQVQAALSVLAAAGKNPSALSVMNPSLAGSDSMSPATPQRGILGAFGTGNPDCQNAQSHQPNTSDKTEPSENGPATRPGLGYYLKKIGLFFVFVVVILFLLTIVL